MQTTEQTTLDNETKLANWRKSMSQLALQNKHNALPDNMRIDVLPEEIATKGTEFEKAEQTAKDMSRLHDKTFVVSTDDTGFIVVEKIRGERKVVISESDLKLEKEKTTIKTAFVDYDRTDITSAENFAKEMTAKHSRQYIVNYNRITEQYEIILAIQVVHFGKFVKSKNDNGNKESNIAIVAIPTHNVPLPSNGRLVRVKNKLGSFVRGLDWKLTRKVGESTI